VAIAPGYQFPGGVLSLVKKKDCNHLKLLYDISELSGLIRESTDISNLLERTVTMISQHLKAEVCSIYLYEEKTGELVLKATKGLNPKAVEKIRMTCGTGLVGATLEEQQPICEGDAPRNPNFKYFSEAHEETFRSFLSVPIQQGEVRIGVIVVQHSETDYFDMADIRAMRTIASQLSGLLENARLLMDFRRIEDNGSKSEPPMYSGFIKGQAVSPGFAYGPAIVFDQSHGRLLETIDAPSATEDDFNRAVASTYCEIEQLQQKIAERLPESASLIFSAHFMMLKDAQFTGSIASKIRSGTPVIEAIRDVALHYINLFKASPHHYLQEKSKDIEDLAGRILKNLLDRSWEDHGLSEKQVVIASALYPSEILKLAAEGVAGVILTSGGITSHVAILARSLSIPVIIVSTPGFPAIPNGIPVLMDAEVGNIYLNPEKDIVSRFEARDKALHAASRDAEIMLPQTCTKDGERVCLRANINLLSEVSIARELKAEGIGLYRTEFPFLVRSTTPSEEEEYWVYKQLCDGMSDRLVTFRTLDVGGDKLPAYWEIADEPNPQLGLRSIRFSLCHQELFKQQVRAILRAGSSIRELRIMFPMISSLDEFILVHKIVAECKRSLAKEKLPHHSSPLLGAMVEAPAVVEIIDELAREVDFLSIGTNDLVQYLLGVDRMNKRVAYAYRPDHPSVLRTLKRIVDSARRAGKEVSICGEMASDRNLLPFLLGIGIRSLSVDPHHLPVLQRRINALSLTETETYAARLLKESTLEGVLEVIRSRSNPIGRRGIS
jgi:phosphotransferase system enzyme I (PtsP)